MEEDIHFDSIHNKFGLNQLTESILKEFQTYLYWLIYYMNISLTKI